MNGIIIGQEAICMQGLGRVTEYTGSPSKQNVMVRIKLYNHKGFLWWTNHWFYPIGEVELISPRRLL